MTAMNDLPLGAVLLCNSYRLCVWTPCREVPPLLCDYQAARSSFEASPQLHSVRGNMGTLKQQAQDER
jgi:hypothetical protein